MVGITTIAKQRNGNAVIYVSHIFGTNRMTWTEQVTKQSHCLVVKYLHLAFSFVDLLKHIHTCPLSSFIPECHFEKKIKDLIQQHCKIITNRLQHCVQNKIHVMHSLKDLNQDYCRLLELWADLIFQKIFFISFSLKIEQIQ